MREMKDSGIEWIGAIPQDWKTDRLQWHLKEINVSNNPIQTKNILSLTIEAGVIPYAEKGNQGNKAKEDYSQYKIALPDTLVINSMNVIIGAVGISQYFGCVSPVYYVFEPIEGTDLRYIYYLFTNTGFQKEMRKYAKGILEIRLRISSNDMLKRIVPSPPFKEQQRIADYLDKMCAEIDAVLEKTRASIEEYKKLKQAVITQAVTKGIRGDRPMKNSGIEWIGEIPAEWDVIRNAFLYKEKSRLPEENAVSLSLSQVDGLIATDDMKERSLKTSTYDGWKQVRTNDLVLNRFKGHLGVLFAANIEGMVSFHYGVYEPLRQFDSKFFEYLYHSDAYKAILGLKSNGMTIGLQNLSNQNFYSVYSLYPPEEEQQEIIQYLDDKCSGIDALIVQKQEHFTEIENYKKSLIYEYVTGKKEVKTSVLAD